MIPVRHTHVIRTITLLITIFSLSLPAYAKYSGGTGEPNDPYQIATAEDLMLLGETPGDYDKHFILIADIDLDPNLPGRKVFDKAVIAWDRDSAFNGVFDGKDHIILNLTIEGDSYLGLFGQLANEAVIRDMGVVDVDITGSGDYIGGLLGLNGRRNSPGSSVTNCYSTGIVKGVSDVGVLVGANEGSIATCYSIGTVSGKVSIGGLVGTNGGDIVDCGSNVLVLGEDNVGGLLGRNGSITGPGHPCLYCSYIREPGTVSTCYSTGVVSGNSHIGGLVGRNSVGSITTSYSTCTVSGNEVVGGLVGYNWSDGDIRMCYSTGTVTDAGDYFGGLVGRSDGVVIACFWDTQTSGQTVSAGGVGKTTLEMQTTRTFSGWGTCGPIWTIEEGEDYPHLTWEGVSGQIISGYSGTGTSEDPFLIYTPEHLFSIGYAPCQWDKHFRLMADIDLSTYSGIDFNPIGVSSIPFTGVFDGSGHTISNFCDAVTGTVSLFGYVNDPNAEIRNLGLISPKIDVQVDHIGSLVGSLENGIIIACYVEDGSIFGHNEVGGLVGSMYGGSVTNCSFTGNVSGNDRVGGLVGVNSGSITVCSSDGSISGDRWVGGLVGSNSGAVTITMCSTTGSVWGNQYVGGLVGLLGWSNMGGTIANCSSISDVSGIEYVGGLVGYSTGSTSNSGGTIGITDCYSMGSVSGANCVGGLMGRGGKISNCYSTGAVFGGNYAVGGLIGSKAGGVYNCFWDTMTSGQTRSGGGTGLTTTEMQTAETFYTWISCSDNAVWTIDEGKDYPRLWWENAPGQIIEPIHPFDVLVGTGTEDDPYLIYTAEELQMIGLMSCDWDKHFRLMADIDLSAYKGTSFNIIGFIINNLRYEVRTFTGVFDGNGHTISNFSYVSNDTDYIGLFGHAGWSPYNKGEIRNLGLIDPNVDAGTGNYVGSLIGYGGTITNCYVNGGSVSGHNCVGGLVGTCTAGTITECNSSASVSGVNDVGGLIGDKDADTVMYSYSVGTVSGGNWVGGLIGSNSSRVNQCYSTASVSGNNNVGGLTGGSIGGFGSGSIATSYSGGTVTGNENVGGLVGHNSGNIAKSYSSGTVSGDRYVGGLVGRKMFSGTEVFVIDSFWDTEASGLSNSDGGTGKTTAEMQTVSMFLEAGWDFVDEAANGTDDIWWIDEGQDYPRLWWELIPEN